MGFCNLIATCVGCNQVFTCNPDTVPVVVHNGERLPICRNCVAEANPERAKRGLPPISIRPDSYEPAAEYADEDEYLDCNY